MSVKLLGKNILDLSTTTVTVTSATAAAPATRLYDREKSLQCIATAAGQWDITIDQGASPIAVTDHGVINHTLGVAGIALASSPDDITYTDRDTYDGTSGTDVFRAHATQTLRYWRYRVPNFASAPAVGQFFLGAAYTLSVDPAHDPGPVDTRLSNIIRAESVGGFVRHVRLGSMRREDQWTWNVLPDADWQNLVAWYAEIDEGAKSFIMQDIDGSVRWVELLGDLVGQRIHATSATTYLRRVSLRFRDAL